MMANRQECYDVCVEVNYTAWPGTISIGWEQAPVEFDQGDWAADDLSYTGDGAHTTYCCSLGSPNEYSAASDADMPDTPLDEWNAKVDALLAECAAMQEDASGPGVREHDRTDSTWGCGPGQRALMEFADSIVGQTRF